MTRFGQQSRNVVLAAGRGAVEEPGGDHAFQGNEIVPELAQFAIAWEGGALVDGVETVREL